MLKHVKTVMAETFRAPTLRHMLPKLNHMSKIRVFWQDSEAKRDWYVDERCANGYNPNV